MRFRFSTLLVAAGVIIAVWAGLKYFERNHRFTLPEVPAVDVSNALPHVRAPINKAYKAVQKSPHDPDATVALAALLHAYNHYDAAAVAYQRAIVLQPEDFRWTYLLAMVESGRGNSSEAIAGLERALKLDKKGYAAARLNLAEFLFDEGAYERSEELFKEILDDPALGAWANYGYGRLLMQRGDEQAALAQLQQAVEREPNLGSAHYELALGYRRLGDSAASARHLALYEKHKDTLVPRVDQLLFRISELNDNPEARIKKGIALVNRGQFEEAIAEYNQALEYDAGHVGAHSLLIREYGRVGNIDLAEKHYRQALELNPDWPEAHIHFSLGLIAKGRYQEAIDVLSLAVSGNEYSAYAFLQRGMAHEGLRNAEAAIADYRQVIALEPDRRQAHALLGRQLAMTGQADEAIVHLSQAIIERDEQTPALEAALATLYLEKGDKAQALSHFERALADATRYGQERIATGIRNGIRQAQSDSP